MLLPDDLPSHLEKYNTIKDESELVNALKHSHAEGVAFFAAACENETWCEKFPAVIESLLTWMAEELLMKNMDRQLAQIATSAIQYHYALLQPYLRFNVMCQLRDKLQPINSLPFQALSLPFYYLMRKECRDKQQNSFEIKTMQLAEFQILEEFVYTGQSHRLGKIPVEEVPKILQLALKWDLPQLASKCETIFLRDLTDENLFEMLAKAFVFPLPRLQAACCDVINAQDIGVRVSSVNLGLSCQLQVATDKALDLFGKLAPYIAEWVCGQQVSEEPEAIAIAVKCRRLRALDLSATRAESPLLKEIAPQIQQLCLSSVSWLTNASFRSLVADFPALEALDLSSCSQLSAAAWSELIKLKSLKVLSIARCSHVTDAELHLILHAVRSLEQLDISACRHISAQGFRALANRPLTGLNLSRCQLDDADLLEMVSKLPLLAELDLTRCPHISEEALLETVRLAKALRRLNVTETALSDSGLQDLRRSYPLLEVISA